MHSLWTFSPRYLNAKHLKHEPCPQTTRLHTTPLCDTAPRWSLRPVLLLLGEAGVNGQLGSWTSSHGPMNTREKAARVWGRQSSGCILPMTQTVTLLSREISGQTVNRFWMLLKRWMDVLRVWLIFSPSFYIMAISDSIFSILPSFNRVSFHTHISPHSQNDPVPSIRRLLWRPQFLTWMWLWKLVGTLDVLKTLRKLFLNKWLSLI